ncbi:MAG: hypothetical protein AB8I08_20805 [Sandaracinaceae bacterium]
MKPDVDALIRAIEAADLGQAESLAELQAGMAKRAPVFAQLAQLDTFVLTSLEKARLKRALETLAASDARIQERLGAEKRGIAEMLDSVAEARGAVRGYRGGPRGVGAVLRTA